MQDEANQVFIGGYSLGGALAVHYALKNPKKLNGLFLFNPSLKVATNLAWLTKPLSILKTWLVINEDLDFARYESFATNSGGQIHELIKKIDELTEKDNLQLTIPVFTALSLDDATVDPVHPLIFFKKRYYQPQESPPPLHDKRANHTIV